MVLLYYLLLHYFGMFGIWKGAEASFFLKLIECSSSAGVIWNIRCFQTGVLARHYFGTFGMWKGAKVTVDHSNLLDPDHRWHGSLVGRSVPPPGLLHCFPMACIACSPTFLPADGCHPSSACETNSSLCFAFMCQCNIFYSHRSIKLVSKMDVSRH
jgi:hypothetical protein